MVLVESLILITILLYLLYKWSTAKYNVLSDRGIPHDKPIPLFGNLDLKVILGQSSLIRTTLDQYMRYKDKKVYGSYSMRDPVIVIRDVNLIKKIAIKDFDSFPNHQSNASQASNIFNKSLISLRDRKWREMRNTLTPSFTGSKMRLMFELINECCIEGANYLAAETQAADKHELVLEMKDYFTRFANDVIASAAFGIKVNSFRDKTNEFYTVGKIVNQFNGWVMVKFILYEMMPKVMKALGIKIVNEKMINYFSSLVFDAMKYRQEHGIVRPDMIQLLMEAKRQFMDAKSAQTEDKETGEHAEFNDEDLLAQCVLFFFAGFETVSTCLCLTTYEILMNPDVQERLYEEILEMEKELAGKPLNYDALARMTYLEMVISESLRKWPPTVGTDRQCSADYELTDDEGNLVVEIKKKDIIFIPFIGPHHDPEYFPDPEKFDPERFSEENKHKIKPFTYMPFGVGPRSCIANRLAIMEVKSIIYHVLLKFKITASEKTVKDMMDSIRGFQMMPKELFWVKLTPREN